MSCVSFCCRDDAMKIWRSGVDAVRGDHAVVQQIRLTSHGFQLAGEEYRWEQIGRLIVVGAGKGGRCHGVRRRASAAGRSGSIESGCGLGECARPIRNGRHSG